MSAPLERETPERRRFGHMGGRGGMLHKLSLRTESGFTSTYSSWLSQVERWFALITERAIRRILVEQAAQSAGGEGRERGVLPGRDCFRAGLPTAETGARDR